jgi:hypothetical protein
VLFSLCVSDLLQFAQDIVAGLVQKAALSGPTARYTTTECIPTPELLDYAYCIPEYSCFTLLATVVLEPLL